MLLIENGEAGAGESKTDAHIAAGHGGPESYLVDVYRDL